METKPPAFDQQRVDGNEILRAILDRLIQGLVVSWIALGALGSMVLLYLALRFSFVVVIAFERMVITL